MDDALRLLKIRPLTEAELRRRLAERGHESAEIEELLVRLRSAGYVNDRRLAAHYLLTRAERGAGPRRLFADLERRGISTRMVQEVWLELIREGALDPLALVRGAAERRMRRHGVRPLDRRHHARVYNALLRAGFEPGAIRVALDPYFAGLDGSEGDLSETSDDDVI